MRNRTWSRYCSRQITVNKCTLLLQVLHSQLIPDKNNINLIFIYIFYDTRSTWKRRYKTTRVDGSFISEYNRPTTEDDFARFISASNATERKVWLSLLTSERPVSGGGSGGGNSTYQKYLPALSLLSRRAF